MSRKTEDEALYTQTGISDTETAAYKNYQEIQAGVTGGTLFSALGQISSADFVKTVILAAIGAAVSFWVSRAMRWFLKKMKGF